MTSLFLQSHYRSICARWKRVGSFMGKVVENGIEPRMLTKVLAIVLFTALSAWAAWMTDRGLKVVTLEERLTSIESKIDLLLGAHEIRGKEVTQKKK